MENFTIFHNIPWNSDKNIGFYYNNFMKLIKDDDWACFIDADAIHTTTHFGSRIEKIVKNNPEYSFFTCYTNRVYCDWQIAPEVDIKSNDLEYHRSFGSKIWENNKIKVIDVTDKRPFLSGVLMLIKKNIWNVIKFKEKGMLGVDNDFHKKAYLNKIKVGLMTGIYVQHWYRNGKETISHLI